MASHCKKFILSADEAAEHKEAGIESSETVANAQVYTLKQGAQVSDVSAFGTDLRFS